MYWYIVIRVSSYGRARTLIATVETVHQGGREDFVPKSYPSGQRFLEGGGGRPIFDADNNLTNRSLLFFEPLDFPVDDLVGKRLVPLGPYGGELASIFAIEGNEPSNGDSHE
jgi:hypothetical protein